MATWIAHLRIAENLLEHLPGLDPGQFSIGSIAPDSGVPDKKWERFDPPPEVTHFKRSQSVHKDIADLDFYRGYLADIPFADVERFSFRLGYFFHLITDNLWTVQVGKPTSDRFSVQFAADASFIWEVKKDWYGLDHIYVREHPECLFWQFFLAADPLFSSQLPGKSDLDFLPAEALLRQTRYIKNYYQLNDEEIQEMIDRPKQYLSKQEMDRFVVDVTVSLLTIYGKLWPHPPALEGKHSALELIK